MRRGEGAASGAVGMGVVAAAMVATLRLLLLPWEGGVGGARGRYDMGRPDGALMAGERSGTAEAGARGMRSGQQADDEAGGVEARVRSRMGGLGEWERKRKGRDRCSVPERKAWEGRRGCQRRAGTRQQEETRRFFFSSAGGVRRGELIGQRSQRLGKPARLQLHACQDTRPAA